MPLARTFNGRAIVSTPEDGFLDHLSRQSDIREYMPYLYGIAKSYPGVRVLELGTREGNSTLAFLAAAQEVNGHVTSVDPDQRILNNPTGMLPWRGCPWWTFICDNDMDPDIFGKLPAQVDVLFIDTSHEYRHTLDELTAYIPRVAPGGVALLHDTNVYLNPARTEVSSLTPCFGETVPPVTQALDEYCQKTGLTWENLPGDYGLGCIYVLLPLL